MSKQTFVVKSMTFAYIFSGLLWACDDGEGDSTPDAVAPDVAADAGQLDAAVSDVAVPDGAVPDGAVPDSAMPDAALPDAAPIGGDRPAFVYPPSGETPAAGWPVLLLLHGFGAAPPTIDRNFAFSRRVDEDGWIVVVPPALPNEDGALRWTSDFHAEGRGDDVDYLIGVIDEVVARHGGDPERVVVMGHSNGGAMAQHFACYAADRVHTYVNVSGFNAPPADCTPSTAVSAVFIHGTADDAVPYEGRDERPGAQAAAEDWAQRLNCGEPQEIGAFDYDLRFEAETTVSHWDTCEGGTVALWRMQDIPHIIIPNADFLSAVRARALAE